LAFLPDNFLGVDPTMMRSDNGKASDTAFAKIYEPFPYFIDMPSIVLLACPSVLLSNESTPESQDGISIGDKVYKVIKLLFRSQTLIGRGTTVFLVEFPDRRRGVLKDSWITVQRESEAGILQGLHIPYGPDLIDHCILRKTDIFRKYSFKDSLIKECREKRRIVTYPAGVHISDFSSLLELMFAFFDVVICM